MKFYQLKASVNLMRCNWDKPVQDVQAHADLPLRRFESADGPTAAPFPDFALS
jgi:hypothetical protein